MNIIYDAQFFDVNDVINIKNNGVVFTPLKIVDKIIDIIEPKITDKICEPSVGKGIFIYALIDYFYKKHSIYEIVNFINNNLYCYDINPVFIIELKNNIIRYISEKYNFNGEISFDNFKCCDYLETTGNYDLIIGNPPYVKIHNINKNKIGYYRQKYESLSKGNVDLYYGFVEKSLLESKKVGFIIPNTFIKSKSSNILRNKLKNRINIIYDFKTEKIWKDISTYTCIIYCDESNDSIIYNDIKYDKSELDKEIWFNENCGEKSLNDMINYCGIGIQTSADNYFISKRFDEKYMYIDENKIELEFCKKIIKASKSKNIENFNYVIYPYDNNGIPYTEDYISFNFPLAYTYLLSIKDELLKRKLNHNYWYIYGRNQGLIREKIGTQLILPITFLKSRNIHFIEIPKNDEILIQNGILVDVNDYNKFIDIISNEKFLLYLESSNKTLPDKQGTSDLWLTLTSNSIKNYKY